MKTPATPRPRGAGEKSDTNSDQRIISATSLPSQPTPRRLGEITTDIVVSLIAHRYDTLRRGALLAELALGRRSSC